MQAEGVDLDQHVAEAIVLELVAAADWREIARTAQVCKAWHRAASAWLAKAQYEVCVVETSKMIVECREQAAAIRKRCRQLEKRVLTYMRSNELYHLRVAGEAIHLRRLSNVQSSVFFEMRRLVRERYGTRCWERMIELLPVEGNLHSTLGQLIGPGPAEVLFEEAEQRSGKSVAERLIIGSVR